MDRPPLYLVNLRLSDQNPSGILGEIRCQSCRNRARIVQVSRPIAEMLYQFESCSFRSCRNLPPFVPRPDSQDDWTVRPFGITWTFRRDLPFPHSPSLNLLKAQDLGGYPPLWPRGQSSTMPPQKPEDSQQVRPLDAYTRWRTFYLSPSQVHPSVPRHQRPPASQDPSLREEGGGAI